MLRSSTFPKCPLGVLYAGVLIWDPLVTPELTINGGRKFFRLMARFKKAPNTFAKYIDAER